MKNIFYVIEVNKGKGAAGIYLDISFAKNNDIYKAIKFHDEASALAIYNKERMTKKDWIITEHEFMEQN